MKKPQERDNLDLLELVCQLHSRSSRSMNKDQHDDYVEARNELEKRLSVSPDAHKETYTQNDIDTEPPHKTKGKFISVEDHQKEIEELKAEHEALKTEFGKTTLDYHNTLKQLTSKESDVKKAVEALEKMCDYHENQATWDKGDNGYYEAKKLLSSLKGNK